MVKKRSLKSARKTRKISKQKGGVLCDVPNSRAFFEWDANSCFFDTTIIGWLHAADVSLRRSLVRMYKISPEDDPRKNIAKRLINIYDLLRLNPEGIHTEEEAVKEATRIRNLLRDSLQICPLFKRFDKETKKYKIFNLKNQQAPDELFLKIMDTINIKNIITNIRYTNLREYPSAPKRDNKSGYKDILDFNPLNKDYNIINLSALLNNIFSSSDYIVNDQSKMKYKTSIYECAKNPSNCIKYIQHETITGTSHGILPISINRKRYFKNKDGSFSTRMDETRIRFEETIILKSSNKEYELVSVICHTGGSGNAGHYTAYYKCNDSTNWIFYNDLGVRISTKGGGKCEDAITTIVNKNYSNKDTLIKELNKTFCTNILRNPENGNSPGLQAAIEASRADQGKYIRNSSAPLYINVGPIDSWQNEPSPGLRLAPTQSSVLLFYKEVPRKQLFNDSTHNF